MARRSHLRELLVGVEGLALLRYLYDGSELDAAQRLAEVAGILAEESLDAAEVVPEADARSGYGAWSETYDEPGNPIIALEQPAVWSILDRLPPGRALDAACGTGRHYRHLSAAGHVVVGVDLTREMLVQAPASGSVEGDIRSLPLQGLCFDLVVCGLALAHVSDLNPAVAEMSRVLRPGGRLVISVLHPFQAHLGWHAPFQDAAGNRGFVREHPHTHADYLNALRGAGLALQDCVEPVLTAGHISAKRRAFRHIPAAALAAYSGLPGVLIWDAQKM